MDKFAAVRKVTRLFAVATPLLTLAYGQQVVLNKRIAVAGCMQCTPAVSCRDAQGNYYIMGRAEAAVLTEKVAPNGSLIWRNLSWPMDSHSAFHDISIRSFGVVEDPSSGVVIVYGPEQLHFKYWTL